VKTTLANSFIILLILSIISYFCYQKYKSDIEIAKYNSVIEERLFLLNYLLINKKRKNKKYNIERLLKLQVITDLNAINRYNNLKSKIDMKQYCISINDIKDDLNESFDFNISTQKIIQKLCVESK